MFETPEYTHLLGIAVVVSAVSFAATGLGTSDTLQKVQGPSENIHTEEGVNIWVYKNGELVDKQHNVLMEGEQAIENQLRSGGAHSWDYIAVGNGSAPVDASTSLASEITNCGLSAKSGSFEDNGGSGNWNLTVTFDATCDDVDVNTTAQYSSGAGSDEDYFAGAALGRTINLYSGDSLTIEWSNEVT